MPTVGAACFSFDMPRATNDKHHFEIQLWDTAGSERYAAMLPMYIRGAQSALVVADVRDDDSIAEVKNWVEMLKGISPYSSSGDFQLECRPIFILNKCDLATDSLIEKQEEILRKIIKDSLHLPSRDIHIIKTCGLNGIGVYSAPGQDEDETQSSQSSEFDAIVPCLHRILATLAQDNELIAQRTAKPVTPRLDINEPMESRKGGGCC